MVQLKKKLRSICFKCQVQKINVSLCTLSLNSLIFLQPFNVKCRMLLKVCQQYYYIIKLDYNLTEFLRPFYLNQSYIGQLIWLIWLIWKSDA